ncbi:helix-turn-helix domain-containing protein [Patescibacteria group bacterium]
MLPTLLTIDDVADLFQVSKSTIYRICESRIIPFYRLRGAIRLKEEDVLGYLESQRVKPREEWFYVAPHKSHPKKYER